jgi:electron transport complex protein RnfD
MTKLLIVSPSPHIHGSDSVKRNMYGVIIALLPALLAALWYFGLGALIVTVTSIAACMLFEYLIQRFMMKTKTTLSDGSAMVTGLLLAFNLPSNLPIWIIIIGAAVAIGIGKMTFGGLGNNPFNPALVGRVFLLISFPTQMTSWPIPSRFPMAYIDAATGASPLALLKEGIKSGVPMTEIMGKLPAYTDMFFGYMGGSAGEIAGIALIIGFVFLLLRKIITWHIPVAVVGTIAVFTLILNIANPDMYAGPAFHILTGGVLLGAIFMATDYATSPMSKTGMIIYGIGIGAITVLIRVFGSYPEGVSFAILIMNGFTPLINRYVKPKKYG